MKFDPTQMDKPGFDEWFAKYRYIQDEYADDVAVEIVHSPHYVEFFAAFHKIRTNAVKVNFQIPKAAGSGDGPCIACLSDEKHNLLNEKLNNYFNDTTINDYISANIEEIKPGCEFFNIYNANAMLALVSRSLLKQYAAYNATNVLMFTKMIKDAPNRRILESMRFTRDVMAINGYEPDGRGIRNIQILRLVHAIIRARINAGKYDRLKFINEIASYVSNVADVVNDRAALDNDQKLAEVVNYLIALAKYLNDKVDEIEKFNLARKDKTKPLRNINERAADLKQSFNYLIEIQDHIRVCAEWLNEHTKDYNDITFLVNKESLALPHFVNDLERYTRQIEWNEKEWGNPINQQDMIFAIHTFSVEVIDGIIESGDELSPKEIEDYYLAWHHIGHCLGVKDEINPKKYADGRRLQKHIYKKEFTEYNPNGDALAQPLLRFMKSILPFNSGPQIRAVIANYNSKEDYEIIKRNLKVDLEDIDFVNMLRLKNATFLLKVIVKIRALLSAKDPNYRYSSFILEHLGIIDLMDKRLTPAERNDSRLEGFSGIDAEGDFIPEDPKENISLPATVIKSFLSKIFKKK